MQVEQMDRDFSFLKQYVDFLSVFQEDGVVAVESCINPETLYAVEDSLKQSEDDPKLSVIMEPDEVTRRSTFGLHLLGQEHNNPISEFLHENPIVKLIAETVLGSRVHIYQSHINHKVAKHGKGYGWHSDFTYWYWEDGLPEPKTLSLVFPLAEHNHKNGPLHVLRGSHHYMSHPEWNRNVGDHETAVRHDLTGGTEDGIIQKDQIESIYPGTMVSHTKKLLGTTGDMFVLDGNAWHSSPDNASDLDRPALFVILNSIDNVPEYPKGGGDSRPEPITNRNTNRYKVA